MIINYILYIVLQMDTMDARSQFPVAISQEHLTYNACMVALDEFKKLSKDNYNIIVGTCVKK